MAAGTGAGRRTWKRGGWDHITNVLECLAKESGFILRAPWSHQNFYTGIDSMKTIFSEDHSGVLVKMLWPQSEEDSRGREGGAWATAEGFQARPGSGFSAGSLDISTPTLQTQQKGDFCVGGTLCPTPSPTPGPSKGRAGSLEAHPSPPNLFPDASLSLEGDGSLMP